MSWSAGSTPARGARRGEGRGETSLGKRRQEREKRGGAAGVEREEGLGRGAAWILRERVAAEDSRRSAGRGRRGGGGGDNREGESRDGERMEGKREGVRVCDLGRGLLLKRSAGGFLQK